MDYPQVGRQSGLRRLPEGGAIGADSEKNRPKSRRGNYDSLARENSQESEIKKNGSTFNMRPGSAYRGGTASRLSTGSFGAPPPTATGRLGTAGFNGISMMDRPITQQGLSGMRTSTGVGRNRQLRDRRYWEEVLNMRIKALRTEVNRLQRLADTAARERSANKHYEARGRELAQELTDLQGRLSDYNVASQLVTASDIVSVQKQATELETSNNQLSAELEKVFSERQHKESQLKQITEQIHKEQNAMDVLIKDMSPNEKTKYLHLKEVVSSLQEESDQARMHIEEMSKLKNDLEKQISMSQMKTHMVDLLRKLMTVEEKRDSLKEEMNNKLQPAQERDQLLIQVREDNAAIASMESNAQAVKEDIKRAHDLLEQADQDLEEGQSERHQKYRELKKREETMESFMKTFELNKKEEKTRIAQLESDIVFALEHSSSNLDQLNFDEIDILRQKNGTSATFFNNSDNDNKNVETLIKDYERIENQLKKSNTTRERLETELITLPDKINALKSSVSSMSNLDILRTDGASRKKQLINEAEMLKEKLVPTENAVKEAANKYHELQSRLDGNEMYAQLNAMEEKLAEIESNNSALREDIASITIKTDYEPLKKQVFDVVKTLSEKLSSTPKAHLY